MEAATRRSGALKAAWVVVAVAVVASILYFTIRHSNGASDTADTGPLVESSIPLPTTIEPPQLTDATRQWGLNIPRPLGFESEIAAAGVALHDLDRDGDLDLVVAHDGVDIYLWHEAQFLAPMRLLTTGARAITAADVDADGWPDLLVARTGDTDTIIWGGEWVGNATVPTHSTDLVATGASSGLLAADLSGDGITDIVRLSRGNGRDEFDTLWTGDPDDPRVFSSSAFSNDTRLSLAGEIADIDGDGLLDVWITRDLGWHSGGDSLYSRQGNPAGPWTDIAQDLGVALEIDGMGITLADLNGDLELDAYVSDLGNNEILVRDGDGFSSTYNTGAARIRPPESGLSVVSSSWATGVVDLNLDGRLDLVVANGGFPDGDMTNRIPDTEVALVDPPAILIGIGDGQFVEAWPDLELSWTSVARGLTIGDIDNDGDDDIIFVAVDGTLSALRNDASGATITIRSEAGCRTVGAIATVTQGDVSYQAPLVRHTYGGAHSPDFIVGYIDGDASVVVSWPDGSSFVELVSGTRSPVIVVPCPNER